MRTGEEFEQPAGIVVLSAFVFGNTQQLLLAGIGEPYDPATGKGVVGKNYAYQFEAGGVAFFEDKWMNPFIGAPGMSVAIDDFNGENFDHGGLGLLRRRLHRRPATAARRRSADACCRMGRRAGARTGSAQRPSGITT